MAKRFGAVAWPTAICAVAAAGTLLTQHGAGAGSMPFAAFTLGNLLTGASGSALHEISKVFGEGFLDQLFDRRPGIDENHAVLRELRHAQLDALRLIRQEFDNGWKWNAGVDRRTKGRSESVSKALASFIDDQSTDQAILTFAKFQSESRDEAAIREAVRQSLTRSFDKGLAVRHATGGDTKAQQQSNEAIVETFQKLRAITEAAVLTEFQRTISPKKDEPPEDAEEDPLPTTFRELFAGTETKNGWFDLYLRAAAERLKTLKGKNPGQFEKIWQAEQAAITNAILETHTEMLSRIGIGVQDLQERFKVFEAALFSGGFSPTKARELEAERDKYKITIEAAIKELGKVTPDEVGPDNLINVLGAVFSQYQAIKEALTRPANDSGKIRDRKSQAVAALDAGNLEQAETLLNEILVQERQEAEERRSDWLAALLRQAESYAMLGRIALARRNLADAVQKFQSGADELAPADSETRWSYTLKAANALQDFGDAAGDNTALTAAISLYAAALKDAPRDRVPPDWAMTQNNLGLALWRLGEREAGTAQLEEAVAAYRDALLEYTRDRVPLDWAMTQNNLGNALGTLGEREAGTARLEEAVAAYHAALQERTQDRAPLAWAMTQNNLGAALQRLGAREASTSRLEEAVAAYRAALQEYTQDRVPLAWAQSQHNLANALAELAGRQKSAPQMAEALTCMKNAVDGYTQCGEKYWLPIAQARLTKIQSALAALQT